MKKNLYKYTSVFLAAVFLGSAAYAQPIVNSVSPPAGPVSGGTFITISGTGFAGAQHVLFGKNGTQIPVQCWNFTSTSINCMTPAVPSPGPADVSVLGSDGIGVLPGGFNYHP